MWVLSDMSQASQGFSLVTKLKREHLELTSFSRMRVDLAVQVCLTFELMTVCNLFNVPIIK